MRVSNESFRRLAGGLATTLVLAGCTTSSTSSATTTSTTAVKQSSTTTSSTTSTTSTTTSTTAAKTNEPCSASQLKLALKGPSAAAGSEAIPATLTNTSNSKCYLSGYPGLQLINNSNPQVTVVKDGPSVSVPSEPVKQVNLVPGAVAYFVLGFSDATGYSGRFCPTSTDINVAVSKAPQSGVLTSPAKIAAYGGTIQDLVCGQIYTTPFLSALPAGY